MPELGHVRPASSEKARSVLGWQPSSGEDAILATAESLIALGLVSKQQAFGACPAGQAPDLTPYAAASCW